MKSALALAAVVVPALCAVPAAAADEDTQLWLVATVSTPVGENLTANFEIQPRFRTFGDQVQFRPGIDYKVSDRLTLGGAVVYTESGGPWEFRTQQQATLTLGQLALRTRVEQRWYDGGDRPQIRLRQRAQWNQPLAKDLRATVSGEILYIARSETRGADDRVDQLRLQTALLHRFSPRLEGGIGYGLLYTPRKGQPDRLSHAPQLSLTLRL